MITFKTLRFKDIEFSKSLEIRILRRMADSTYDELRRMADSTGDIEIEISHCFLARKPHSKHPITTSSLIFSKYQELELN